MDEPKIKVGIRDGYPEVRGRLNGVYRSGGSSFTGEFVCRPLGGVVVLSDAFGRELLRGPEIRLTAARVEGVEVIASLEVKDRGAPVATAAEARALAPNFTLAVLAPHPVDRLPAWKSLLLTGGQTTPSLPIGGPGSPALTGVRQPGAESSGTLAGEDGAFTYAFAAALPAGFDPAQTLRVGVWLLGNGTRAGTSTFDFRPAGGAPAPRDTVLQESCNRCHGELLCSPRGASGVKMCVTCHTWQNADPDTTDPAALYPASAATDPNPLDFGRMVHRIHRGKDLPTLYTSTSTAPAPTLPSATALPLPYTVFRPGLVARNVPVAGRKYSIVGPMSREVIFGEVGLSRPEAERQLPVS